MRKVYVLTADYAFNDEERTEIVGIYAEQIIADKVCDKLKDSMAVPVSGTYSGTVGSQLNFLYSDVKEFEVIE